MVKRSPNTFRELNPIPVVAKYDGNLSSFNESKIKHKCDPYK